ncbi:MAG: class I SAM-dependent rRNA methyltransferase [Acetanaerobacterium sp.]
MQQKRGNAVVSVSAKAEQVIRTGHPWVYDTEVLRTDGKYENGDIVDIISLRGSFLGAGFINDHSKIRLRMLSRSPHDSMDEAFFAHRLQDAWDYRKTVMGNDLGACRVIFGEADFLPGLTVDRFENILVTQVLSLGIEKNKAMLFSLLHRILAADGVKIDGIYERNDVRIRELEGMTQGKGFFTIPGTQPPQSTTVTIRENEISYLVDFENGQKTGFFLDQKYNRRAIGTLARGRHVLDCFTHTGSFALNAALGGAAHVTAVDISQEAVDMAAKNAALNGLDDRMKFTTANVFDLLPTLANSPDKPYDMIILDPPAFTKSRKTAANAIRGYKEINLRAMKLLPSGGYLATCSCSHFMTDTMFRDMLESAASDAGIMLRQVEIRTQSPDHPVLWNVPETDYLKFYIFQVI